MHLIREEVNMKIPIKRKGSKYIARASSDLSNSVPVVIAIRDMLNLARTSREVRQMIHHKLIKLNGRLVTESNESIKLLNVLHADKDYILTLSPTHRFTFEEVKSSNTRNCKVINKTMTKNKMLQLNLHDGSNLLSKDKSIAVGDSVILDFSGKLVSHNPLKTGAKVLVIRGKLLGTKAKVKSIADDLIEIEVEDSIHKLNKNGVIVI